jgi:hypothetical protein
MVRRKIKKAELRSTTLQLSTIAASSTGSVHYIHPDLQLSRTEASFTGSVQYIHPDLQLSRIAASFTGSVQYIHPDLQLSRAAVFLLVVDITTPDICFHAVAFIIMDNSYTLTSSFPRQLKVASFTCSVQHVYPDLEVSSAIVCTVHPDLQHYSQCSPVQSKVRIVDSKVIS